VSHKSTKKVQQKGNKVREETEAGDNFSVVPCSGHLFMYIT